MSKFDIINQGRIRIGPWGSDPSYGFNGAFELHVPGESRKLLVIASDEMGWQHVSVSFMSAMGEKPTRETPSWDDMSYIKDLFWEPEDVVIQIHPAAKNHINIHPGCLHLWRCIDGREQPLPPTFMVGPKGMNENKTTQQEEGRQAKV